jgi:hypothetical protein
MRTPSCNPRGAILAKHARLQLVIINAPILNSQPVPSLFVILGLTPERIRRALSYIVVVWSIFFDILLSFLYDQLMPKQVLINFSYQSIEDKGISKTSADNPDLDCRILGLQLWAIS